MEIHNVKISDINPVAYNPRTLTKEEYQGLLSSIRRFGFVQPVIINERSGNLVSGHQRVQVAKAMGFKEVPVVYVDLNDAEEKQLNLTMNSQAISGKWDMDKLSEILEELKTEDGYEELRLHKLEPLDLSGVDMTSLEDGASPAQLNAQDEDRDKDLFGGGVKQYTIVFDEQEQQDEFMEWVGSLRGRYPEGETIASRILLAIRGL